MNRKITRVNLDNMKSLQRFILEAQSRLLYREFSRRVIKLKDPELRKDVKSQIRQGYLNTINISDENLKYRLSIERTNIRYLDELVMFSN
jgi:hypothetical protein